MDVDDDSRTKHIAFESDRTRRLVLLSYWVVVLLALPLWWSTTSLQRLDLPTAKVLEQQANKLNLPLEIWVDTSPIPVVPGRFLADVDERLNGILAKRGHSLGVELKSSISPGHKRYQVQFDVRTSNNRLEGTNFLFGTKSILFSEIPRRLAETLADLLIPFSIASSRSDISDHRVVQYAPRYRLAFSLLNEDAADGGAAFGWDIEKAINRHFSPSLNRLNVLHNFSIESQVQFHAPLAFEPKSLSADDATPFFGLTPEQLTIFVNSEQWTLSSSVSNDPVLHFLLFVPSRLRRPLHVLDIEDKPSTSHSFIIPQWGGIIIYNPPTSSSQDQFHLNISTLQHPFSVFNAQFLALLGVPALPKSITSTESLSDWQLHALLRRRIVETTQGSKEVLGSIVKLVNQIEGMPVGKDVQADFQDALNALDKVHIPTNQPLSSLMHYASQAHTLASRAFFNPGMLALLYFPAEHKLAVYTPLFAPVAVPLIVAVLREAIAWRKAKREAVLQGRTRQ